MSEKMPDKIYAYLENGVDWLKAGRPMHTGASPFHDSIKAVKYVRADLAQPAPASDDVLEAVDFLYRRTIQTVASDSVAKAVEKYRETILAALRGRL